MSVVSMTTDKSKHCFVVVIVLANSPWVSTCQQAIASENTSHESTGFSSPKTNRARCYSPSVPWTILVWFLAQSKNNILSCTVHLGKYKLQRQGEKKSGGGKRLSSVNTAFKRQRGVIQGIKLQIKDSESQKWGSSDHSKLSVLCQIGYHGPSFTSLIFPF